MSILYPCPSRLVVSTLYSSCVCFLDLPVCKPDVGNIRCGGNDSWLGFYAAEWNGLSGDTILVLCGVRDHN